MKKLAAFTLSIFLVSGTALADTPKDAEAQPTKGAQPAKPKAAKKAQMPESAIAAQLEELRQAVQSQQEELQLLKEELAKRDRQIDEAREAAAAANARAAEASSKAAEAVNTTAEVKSAAVSLNSTVGDLKASNEVVKTTLAKEQAAAQKAAEEGPSTIHYKGINLTPGGFIEAATVFRNRATSGNINTPFTGIPYPNNAPSAGGGLYNTFDSAGYSLNRAPDFLVKAAFDPGWGHYEVVGILSDFRNRIYPCGALGVPLPAGCATATSVAGAFNDSRVGGGVGFTARLPVVAKKVDLVGHFQGGDGIGRYSSAQLADVTARPNGTLALIRSAARLGSLELHPSTRLDLYAYGGGEYAARTAYTFTNAAGNPVGVGYGSSLFNNSGCSTEAFPTGAGAQPPGTPNPPSGSGFPATAGGCAGDIHHIVEGTLGFWHKFYNGPKGRVQWGVQYSYLTKVGWSGNNNSGNAAAGPSLRPKAVDNMVFTSFRYYLP